MEIEYDPRKERQNKRDHGVSLELAQELDWDHASCWPDLRFHYDELRMNALVPKDGVLYFLTFVERGERTRILSLRKARNRERKRYAGIHNN